LVLDKFLAFKQLIADLMAEFPEMRGFSYRNLKYARQWYLFYSQEDIKGKQLASLLENDLLLKIFSIPWWHNIVIIQKCGIVEQALFYVCKTIENNWSRSVLSHQIESDLFSRRGKAVTNFEKTLPATQSDLAKEIIKNPYNFDFLAMTDDYTR
jgi:predicted nuclease of restriction endonuclease-like (RecB) superfamily